jgi:mRNA-degrading endonuclease YafQ of YafQ-DinJ toxin-antitoxin module
MIQITEFARSPRFEAEARALEPTVARALGDALELLLRNPLARSLRLHPLTGFGKPTIWKIDVFANHSWQVTFEMAGTVAHLKRVATHSEVDRDPRG